ncbi:alpha-hydroxy-acid oxidizing protein [Pseudoroseomonas wenyumeiae]
MAVAPMRSRRGPMADPGRQNQARIFTGGFAGRRPLIPCAPEALERAALARMRGHAAAYVAGGAGLERSMAANRAAFDHYRILQRVLRDVSDRRLSVELFGRRLPLPLLLAPIGVLEMAQRRGDLAAARAAASEGVPFVTSSQSSSPMEEIAAACGEGPRWFQLYWSSSDALMRSFMQRAEAAGYEAIVLTLDTTQLGWRPRDLDRGYLPFLRGRGWPIMSRTPSSAACRRRTWRLRSARRWGCAPCRRSWNCCAAGPAGCGRRWPRRARWCRPCSASSPSIPAWT